MNEPGKLKNRITKLVSEFPIMYLLFHFEIHFFQKA